jgi:hypothetical protein
MADSTCIDCGVPLYGHEYRRCTSCAEDMRREAVGGGAGDRACGFADCLGGVSSGLLPQMCGDEHPDFGRCTRARGHRGAHIACSLSSNWHQHVSYQWLFVPERPHRDGATGELKGPQTHGKGEL